MAINPEQILSQAEGLKEDKKTAVEYIQQAQKASANRDNKQAIINYEKAIEAGAKGSPLYCSLGNAYHAFGHFHKAEQLAISALLTNPGFKPAYRLLGESLQNRFPAKTVENCYHGFFPSYIGNTYFPDEMREINRESSQSITRKLALPAENYRLFPPKRLYNTVINEFTLAQVNSPDRYLDIVENGSVWYDDFNIIIHDGDNNRVRDLPAVIGYGPLLSHLMKKTPALHVEGTAMLLAARGSNGFGHWMLDTLPALEGLSRGGFELADIDKFIISGGDLGFKKSTLLQLGIDEDRIVDASINPHVSADKLLVIDAVTNMGRRMGHWVPEFYNKAFLENAGEAETDPNSASQNAALQKRIYISRGGVGTRGVDNEEEFVEFLKLYDVERVALEELSMTEQAKLLSECAVVIAPHGAALTNLMYCRPGTKVVELFSAHVVPCFWIMTRLRKLDYYNHYCGETDKGDKPESSIEKIRTLQERVKQSYTVNLNDISDLFEYAGIAKK